MANQRQRAFADAMHNHFADVGGTIGVMVLVAATGETFTFHHDQLFPTASTLKIPVLYELYRQADAGEITLTDRLMLKAADRVPGSGVLQALDEGLNPTIRDIAELMITVSDNYATDLLIAALGKDRINATMHELGLGNTHLPMTIREMFCAICGLDPDDPETTYDVLREGLKHATPEPGNRAYARTPDNCVSTPEDMVTLMGILDGGQGLSDSGRDAAIRILKNQNFNTIIPARLPDDVDIETAHKTGSLRGIRNDVGTVYAPGLTYHIAFMSSGLPNAPEGVLQMSRASRWIWDFLHA